MSTTWHHQRGYTPPPPPPPHPHPQYRCIILLLHFQHEDTFPSMGVYDAWNRGYSGVGIRVSILDDGVEPDHPDLIENYVCHTINIHVYTYCVKFVATKMETVIVSCQSNNSYYIFYILFYHITNRPFKNSTLRNALKTYEIFAILFCYESNLPNQSECYVSFLETHAREIQASGRHDPTFPIERLNVTLIFIFRINIKMQIKIVNMLYFRT